MSTLVKDTIKQYTPVPRGTDTFITGTDFDGYSTIKFGKLEKCRGCGRVLQFVEVDLVHVIVVWEERDDEKLLEIAAAFKKRGLDPSIVEYKASYGKAHEFYSAVEKGLIEL